MLARRLERDTCLKFSLEDTCPFRDVQILELATEGLAAQFSFLLILFALYFDHYHDLVPEMFTIPLKMSSFSQPNN